MDLFVLAALRETTKEVAEEVVKQGGKEFAKQGAKHISGKVVKGTFKGVAQLALETTLTTAAKQAISKEVAQDFIEQLTTTGTKKLFEHGAIVTTKTASGQIGKQVITQAVGSGGKAACGAGGKKIAEEFVSKGAGVGFAVDAVFFVGLLTKDVVQYHKGGIAGAVLVANTASNALGIPGGYVGAAIGQALIPIPLVGGLVGGVIGAWAGNILVHTVQSALT